MKYKIRATQNISRNCMVCGVENDFGLKSRFYETESDELIALFTPQAAHQSYPNITHGGISAAILDETIGRAIMITHDRNTFGVTVELSIRYKKSVPYGVDLKAVGRITRDGGRIFEGSGELYLPDGTLAATAKGKFMKRKLEQITDKSFTENEWFVPEDFPAEISI
ncbi:PaaI family thioesterase [Malonomonas rubra]|uniref:PaaI family thioesterase n=1 Tax=Malonomonas rubra TaxID=57040 RepID=UPI0026F10D27|nr:PaaI family thioesterase [Malonomonas rubra]